MIRKIWHGLDWGIFISQLTLMIFGLTLIRSVAPDQFGQQLFYCLVGFLFYFIFSLIDYEIYSKLAVFLYLFCLFGLILPFIFGVVTRGSVRWLRIGEFTIQPSELVKPLLILVFASIMSRKRAAKFRGLVVYFLVLVLPVLMIFVQPDLGSSLVVILVWLAMLIASGVPWKSLLGIGLMVAVTMPIGWQILQDYQRERITTFLYPYSDPMGSGYNLIQAMIAVGSGQLWGRGLGRGPQSHLQFLPERHTDFIFASLSEELGFLGGIFLLGMAGVLMWRILKVAQKSKSQYGFLVGVGVFSMIFSQLMINVGMNLGLVPITGITLPLVSYGGSSLLGIMVALGIIQNLARSNQRQPAGD